jgi:hypothetical protein
MRFFLLDRVIQENGWHVYNMHSVVEKQFNISIASVRSRGGSQFFKLCFTYIPIKIIFFLRLTYIPIKIAKIFGLVYIKV